MEPELLRLQRIEIDGLFGIYDHRIELNMQDRVTILHGPNGVGKTTALQMVNALTHHDIGYFHRVPFRRFGLGFVDGSYLELRRIDDDRSRATISLSEPANRRQEGTVDLAPTEKERLASAALWTSLLGARKPRMDTRTEELLDAPDLLQRSQNRIARSIKDEKEVLWLTSFLDKADSHFIIEAQRLVRPTSTQASSASALAFSDRPQLVASVVACSRDYQEKLSETMANYGRQAQALDQTFPQRLISPTEKLSDVDLQNRLRTLEQEAEEFKAIGILDETQAHPIDVESFRDMDDTQGRVMTLYVQDSETKLAELQSLAGRTRLLLDNINGKYQHKRIRVDRERGLVAERDNGDPLPLDALSSGEQREFVLHYDLLFRVKPNTIVLIDEPELSLHVTWQKKFLPDLLDIVELSGIDATVATHSPYVAGYRDDLMVRLGDPL